MLMEPMWNVGDATRLMLHAGNTWSGPGGWLKTMKWAILPRKGQPRRLPPCLWFLLALPSMLVFIAWPLSGLTMETTPGYCRPEVATPASVTGFSHDTFNERGSGEAFESAGNAWRSSRDARIPGAGIIYTPEGFDRSNTAFLKQIPAVLPRDDGVPPIFLVPQAETPVDGTHWGLLLQYNCSVIDEAKDFQIINKFTRPLPRYPRYGRLLDQTIEFSEDRKTRVTTLNKTDQWWAYNLDVVAEFGYELWSSEQIPQQLQQILDHSSYDCYFKINESITEDYPGMNQDYAFEVALWQGLEDRYQIYIENFSLPYNLSVGHNITDYYGDYNANDYHRLHPLRSSLPMTAIGVQCRASSSVGRADINGGQATFSNFQRTDTRLSVTKDRCAWRLAAQSPFFVMRNNVLGWDDWVGALFRSSGAASTFYGSHVLQRENGSRYTATFLTQPAYLQAEQLRRSLLHAYASYAVQLVYNGGDVYTLSDGSTLSFTNPNGTAFQRATVIKPGVVSAIVPLGLFCVWALVSSTLGLMYGFRRRWTETLDGHTMFRMGAELSEHARRELLETSNTGKKEDDKALNNIPGLVGDSKPDMFVGRIGLVASEKARKNKIYE